MDTFLIIGGGLAGASAAGTLRAEGFTGNVVLAAGEDETPYIRPPLSKEFLLGKAPRTDALVHPRAWYAENEVKLLRAKRVVSLDVGAHEVMLDGGSHLSYSKVLLATGASPRRLPAETFPQHGNVHYLRTFADSEALRAALAVGGRRVVVVGAGWIGLEVSAAARTYGNDVCVLGREAVPLEPVLGAELGTYVGEVHRRHGVQIRMSTEVAGFEVGGRGVTGVRVADGEVVPAEVVVVGVGALPNTDLAAAAGLAVDNGVLVDASLRAGSTVFAAAESDVFAAGDVANAFHPALGKPLRVEHWANAERQGEAAARAMLGQHVSFDRVPYFYTDQFEFSMEFSGYNDLMADARVVYRGDLQAGEFIAFWVSGPNAAARVVAGMNVNVWDVNEAIDAIIATGAAHDLQRLCDPSVPLPV